MKMDSKNKPSKRIVLGSFATNTKGPGGVILESFTYMPKTGISA
jgi:hypothetical protein